MLGERRTGTLLVSVEDTGGVGLDGIRTNFLHPGKGLSETIGLLLMMSSGMKLVGRRMTLGQRSSSGAAHDIL